jgi:hypothetical protein
MNITLTDLSGRVIESWQPRASAPGAQRIAIDTSDLATGAYLISLNSNGHSRTLKLMID